MIEPPLKTALVFQSVRSLLFIYVLLHGHLRSVGFYEVGYSSRRGLVAVPELTRNGLIKLNIRV
jgi:hypothetical protein